jgi:hypothetical protein
MTLETKETCLAFPRLSPWSFVALRHTEEPLARTPGAPETCPGVLCVGVVFSGSSLKFLQHPG